MRRVVCIPGGVWQLLTVAGAMRQASRAKPTVSEDTLVVFSLFDGPLRPEMVEAMDLAAGAVWPWRDVRNVADLNYTRMAWGPLIETVRDRIGVAGVDELWLGSLWGHFEKAVAEAFPKARIVLYEDGLHTYVTAGNYRFSARGWLTAPRRSWRLLKSRVRQSLHHDDPSVALILHRHLRRVAAAYLWIGRILPAPDYLRPLRRLLIEPEFLRAAIQDAARVVAVPALDLDGDANGPLAVALGQCFSNYGDLNHETELAGYVAMARRLRDEGFTVLWKEHPRTRRPFYDELADAVEGVYQMPHIGPWPIELFAERLGFARCAGVTSTSLFNFPLLFRIPAFTIADRFLHAFRHPNDQMARLALAHTERLV